MTARKTSIEAYRRMQESGTLSRRKWEVYDALFHHGPLTAAEIHTHVPHQVVNDIGTRLGELRDWGVAAEIGEKLNPSTGNNINLWDVTDQVGVRPPKGPKAAPKPTDEEMQKAVDDIRDMILIAATDEVAKLLAWLEDKL